MFLHPNQLMGAKMQFPEINRIQAVITRRGNSDYLTVKVELYPGHEGQGLAEKLKGLASAVLRLRLDEVVIVQPGVIDSAARMVIDERQRD
jgi:phenylacetate-coenzyme A ligase PaaK-like adenylate-forming protein